MRNYCAMNSVVSSIYYVIVIKMFRDNVAEKMAEIGMTVFTILSD